MGGILPLWFDGAVCDFKELPKPDDKVEMDKVYTYCKNLKNPPKKALFLTIKNSIKSIKRYLNKF